ncbi:MAG TPA: chaperone modulator CbpM [Chitinophagaceae bacterium]|nr:chaperone modulator CbpM [Chitinophagaceae bacterium]
MEKDELIRMESFCMIYEIEPAFLHLLEESGLVEIVHEQDEEYIATTALEQLEKFMRLHHDLDINANGLEAIAYLLQKISDLQDEISRLKNRLNLYE